MREPFRPKIPIVASCIVCTIVTWRFSDFLGSSEFSGGSVTGPLLNLQNVSGYLFPVAAITAFWDRRASAGIALVACLLAVPLYAYFVAPGPFRRLFDGVYSVPSTGSLFWDLWSIAAIAAVVTAAFVSVRTLRQH